MSRSRAIWRVRQESFYAGYGTRLSNDDKVHTRWQSVLERTISMNIGDAAKASGISAKMIRHYESVGLIAAAGRSDGGYRQYSDTDIHNLRFIRHARDLGFSIAEIAQLVSLWHDRSRPSRQVKALAALHIQALDEKAKELLAMKATLEHLANCCRGDDRPECPILASLANGGPARLTSRDAQAKSPPVPPRRRALAGP
jgi:MerR family copper efflux transcriptional regulator